MKELFIRLNLQCRRGAEPMRTLIEKMLRPTEKYKKGPSSLKSLFEKVSGG